MDNRAVTPSKAAPYPVLVGTATTGAEALTEVATRHPAVIILDLEKEGADLNQRLRMRDREFADKSTQLETARDDEPDAEKLREEVSALRDRLRSLEERLQKRKAEPK